jgi:Flp pilus assembly secretin CpaC
MILLFNIFAEEEQKQDEIKTSEQYLVVGSAKNIKFKFTIGNVVVGDATICDYKVDRTKNIITLLPQKDGATQLLVHDQDKQRESIKIIVAPKDLASYIKLLKRLFKDIEGIIISQIETKVVIEGEVYTQDDIDIIENIVKNVPFVFNMVKLSRNAQRILAKKIEKEIASPEVFVVPYKDKMILKGRVYSKEQEQNAEKIAHLYWEPDKVVSVLEVTPKTSPPTRAKTIQISAHYIELSKVLNKNFLFKWTPFPAATAQGTLNFNPQTGSSQFVGSLVTTFTELIPRLNYMKSLGIVRVLENPIISVKSGETATIFSGTKMIIPVIKKEGIYAPDPQDIGATLTVTPTEFRDDIDIKIDISISSLGAPTSTGAIMIDQNQVSTRQFVRSGESIVIGGILRTAATQTKDKQPDENFTETPPMFSFFKSQDKHVSRSQFIIFITPKIMEFAKDANKELMDYFNMYEVYPSGK